MAALQPSLEVDELCTALGYFQTAVRRKSIFPKKVNDVNLGGCVVPSTRKHKKTGVPLVYFRQWGRSIAHDVRLLEYWKITDLLLALGHCTGIPARFIQLKDIARERFLSAADYTCWRTIDPSMTWQLAMEVMLIPVISGPDVEQFGTTWDDVLQNIANTVAPANKRLANLEAEREFILESLAATSKTVLTDSVGKTLLHYVFHANIDSSFFRKKLRSSTEEILKRLAAHHDQTRLIQISVIHEHFVGTNPEGNELCRVALADMPAHMTAGDVQVKIAQVLGIGADSMAVFNGAEEMALDHAIHDMNSITVIVMHLGFLSSVINMQIPSSGDTALMLAVCFSSLQAVKILLDVESVDVGLKTDMGSTALSLAVSMGKRDCVLELLKSKASCLIHEPTESGKTVLEIAMQRGYSEIHDDLLKAANDEI